MSGESSSSQPQEIVMPEWFNPDYPPLRKDNVGQAAVNGQMVSYPKVVRDRVDEAPRGQQGHYSNVSFMMLPEPKETKDGGKLYGFGIVRGHFPNHSEAKRDAERIIRTMDSRNQILCVPQSEWFYITSDPKAYSETHNVDTTKSQEEDEELRKAQARRIAEQQRIAREIEERKEMMRTAKDIRDDPESLDYYTMRRVTLNSLSEEINNLKVRLESVKDVTTKVIKELHTLDVSHPEYKGAWVDRYNVDRLRVGCPAYVPSEKEEREYDALVAELLARDAQNSGESSSSQTGVSLKGKEPAE